MTTIETILEEFDAKTKLGHFGVPDKMCIGFIREYISQSLTRIREEGYQEGRRNEMGLEEYNKKLLDSYKKELFEKIKNNFYYEVMGDPWLGGVNDGLEKAIKLISHK